MEITTREQAKAQGLKRYFSGSTCARGAVHIRRTTDGACMCRPCATARYKSTKASNSAWLAAHPGRVRDHKRKSAAKPENVAKRNEYQRKFRQENPEKKAADTRWRQTAKLNATPPWADRAAIAAIYAEARRLEKETGVAYHVDHIVPLRGKGVCGLHVPWNLRPIPARENYLKSARYASSPDDRSGVPSPAAVRGIPSAQGTLGLFGGSSSRGKNGRVPDGSGGCGASV